MSNEKKKRILITSYWFSPEITPRAFRTFELVKEFSERGYEIDLFLPDKINTNEEIFQTLENCSINYTKSKKKAKQKTSVKEDGKVNNSNKKLLQSAKKTLGYIIGGSPNILRYAYLLQKNLLVKSKGINYDLIISIGLPYYIHLATAIFIKNSKQTGIKVSDYGDPFSFNPAHKRFFALKYVEKWYSKQFDYISIPTEKSIPYYTYFKNKEKIKIIPQGFNFADIGIDIYEKNTIPTFCYAGVFYEGIRNPEYLLKYLTEIKQDFRFIIFTNLDNPFTKNIICKYKKTLGEKLVVNNFIPRKNLIKELSKMDFLINLENDNSNQVPSKIIDYSVSKRPIFSTSQSTFNQQTLNDFLGGKYEQSYTINLESFDIKNVVDQFIALTLRGSTKSNIE